jgi:predicted enzyme related to lactoylglutathione lyase
VAVEQPVAPVANPTHKTMQPFDKISTITIAVTDQDEALTWFTQILGFEKRMDQNSGSFRWLTVAPPQQAEVEFLLASWFPDLVGKNAPYVLSTRDCQSGYEELKANGVEFTQAPEPKPWGIQAVFVDLYGNKYALVQESAQVVSDEAEKQALGLPDLAAVAEAPIPGGLEPV